MKCALDYDDCYTHDPEAWNEFIRYFRQRGHKVYIVTMRDALPSSEAMEVVSAVGDRVDACYFTNRRGKRQFMFAQGINIDVWIDDMPDAIVANYAPTVTDVVHGGIDEDLHEISQSE